MSQYSPVSSGAARPGMWGFGGDAFPAHLDCDPPAPDRTGQYPLTGDVIDFR